MPKRPTPTLNQRAATPRAMAQTEPLMLTVKAKVDKLTDKDGNEYDSPRVVYDIQDSPIPHDVFVTTPLTATLVLAIKAGDVEEADEGTITDKTLPTEFGGRLTEERAQQRRERQKDRQQPQQEQEQTQNLG